MAKTNRELTEIANNIAQRIAKIDSIMEYFDVQIKQLKRDVNFLSELMIQEKTFSNDIMIKLRKIFEWTKSIKK